MTRKTFTQQDAGRAKTPPTHQDLIRHLEACGWRQVAERPGIYVRFARPYGGIAPSIVVPLNEDAGDYRELIDAGYATLDSLLAHMTRGEIRKPRITRPMPGIWMLTVGPARDATHEGREYTTTSFGGVLRLLELWLDIHRHYLRGSHERTHSR